MTHKTKLADNLAALRLLKTLEQENRLATSDEQQILAKYVGWGGLADVLMKPKVIFTRKKKLETLLTEEEYASARESVLTAYYTDPLIIKEIYRSLKRFGFLLVEF